jgi:hypothetical protein
MSDGGYLFVILAALVALVALVLVLGHSSCKYKQAFMAECLADGKKNYECVAMWRAGSTSYVYMPMGTR